MRLLLDENVEKALLNVFPWRESNLGLRRRHPGLDVVRVVDVGLGGRSDPEILEWAAREGRVVVSRDRATLSAEAARRIEGGKPMPGLILLRRGVGVGRILEDLDRFGAPTPNEPPPGYRAARGAGERHPVPASLSLEKTLGTQVRDLMGPPWEVAALRASPPCRGSTGPRRARRSLSRGPRVPSSRPRSTPFNLSPPLPRSPCAPMAAPR